MGQRASLGRVYGSNCRTGEKPLSAVLAFPASPRRRAVNQKRREFVAGSYGSPNGTRTYDLLVDGGETSEKPSLRAHKQKGPPRPKPGGRVGATRRYRLIR